MIGSKRERMLIGALGLGACALVADRIFVLKPAAAEAQPSAATNLTEGGAALAALPPELFQVRPTPEAPDSLAALPDIFDSGRLPNTPAARPVQTVATGSVTEASPFANTYQLRGTFVGENPIAVIGRKRMSVGDSISGYKIIEIASDHVIFQSASGERETLFVPGRKTISSNSHD